MPLHLSKVIMIVDKASEGERGERRRLDSTFKRSGTLKGHLSIKNLFTLSFFCLRPQNCTIPFALSQNCTIPFALSPSKLILVPRIILFL